MNKYRNLLRRVLYLESLLYESNKDKEILKDYLGDELYKQYDELKKAGKIRDPKYTNIYNIIKMPVSDIEKYIDNVKQTSSNTEKRNKAKGNIKPIYNKDGWKVYRITTYEAAVYYGKNTKWCITGRYGGHEERGEWYFDDYIEEYNLDGGYYFYIKSNTEKYCLLRKKNGDPISIWDAQDNEIEVYKIKEIVPDFPSVPGVFDPNELTGDVLQSALYSDDVDKIDHAINAGADLYESNDSFDGMTPFAWHMSQHDKHAVELLLQYDFNVALESADAIVDAINEGEDDLLQVLFLYGLSTNYVYNGISLFEYAMIADNYYMVILFLQNGANIKDPIYPDGYTAFQFAVANDLYYAVSAIFDFANKNNELLAQVINPEFNRDVKLDDALKTLDFADIDYSDYV